MSFILDALKKSEAERQRQAGPALLEMRVVRPRRRWPLWLFIGGGVLILANVVLLAWLLLRPQTPQTSVATAAPVIAPAAPAGAPPIAAPVTPATPADTAPVPALLPPANDAIDADLRPAVPAAPSGRSIGLPSYKELSANLPPLRLDLHVFAPRVADRYALVNMHRVNEGDVTPEGARVVEITPDGVVLEYRGAEFILGRQ